MAPLPIAASIVLERLLFKAGEELYFRWSFISNQLKSVSHDWSKYNMERKKRQQQSSLAKQRRSYLMMSKPDANIKSFILPKRLMLASASQQQFPLLQKYRKNFREQPELTAINCNIYKKFNLGMPLNANSQKNDS